jgi:hypothetical protein
MQQQVYDLVPDFSDNGPTDANIERFHDCYTLFMALARNTASEVGRKKFGYMRSPPLTLAGRTLNAYIMLLDCKTCNSPPSPALVRICSSLDLDAAQILSSTDKQTLRRRVRDYRANLWDTQKHCKELRYEWLEKTAQDRAQAVGDPDWEKKLAHMKRTALENATNRKLSFLTKGQKGSLDQIQIPTSTWYLSPTKAEIYHYNSGVFEAYPEAEPGAYHPYHTIKVPSSDAVRIDVSYDAERQFWIPTLITDEPMTWEDVVQQDALESALLRRNERHLQQTEREAGISTRPLLTTIRANHRVNATAQLLSQGVLPPSLDLTPEMTAFFSSLQKDPHSTLPLIDGALTAGDIQSMFKRAKERTSSDSSTLNYTIWKCLATDDVIAGILSILFSLPFLYGFVNRHWTFMTDFMLEKKPGVRHIHSLRIIGKVAAEFNTILKFLIGKKAMNNYENSSPHDEQHGFRPNRSSIDVALLKIFTFDCARLQKCTVGSMQHDMTAHFNRMYPAMTSLYASKYGIDDNVMLCINRTIEKLQRQVETSLGVSEATYGNTPGTVPLGGMVQGKADVPQWSTQQSNAMLYAFSHLTQRLHISSPSLCRSITHCNISFADNTDAQNSQPPGTQDPIPAVVQDLQHGAQVWNHLVQICGGQLALHKCNWTLIAWEFLQGKLRMVSSTTKQLIMADGNGSFATIDFLSPDQLNVGLGYRICPNGSQLPHYEATLVAITALCQKCMSSHLTENET